MCRLIFCCCFNHEKGVVDVGLFGIFAGVGNFAYQIYLFNVFGMFASMVHIAVYILLFVGVFLKNSNFLIPCIIVQPVEIVLGSGAGTYYLFTEVESVLRRILGVSLGFAAIAVIFLYREYKEESVVLLPIDSTEIGDFPINKNLSEEQHE